MTCFTLLKRKKKIIHRIDCAVPLEKTYNKTTPNKKVDQDRKIPEKSNELPDRKHFCKKRQKIIILDVLELLSEVSSEGYFRQKKERCTIT